VKWLALANGIGSLAAAIVAAAALSGCHAESSPVAEDTYAGAGAESLVPEESLADWVTYASHVSVVTVISEAEMESTPEVVANGEGYVGRTVTLRIERTIWSAPGAAPIEGTVSMTDWGWLLKDGQLRPFASGRLEVGGRYLVPFANINGNLGSISLTAIPVTSANAVATEGMPATGWHIRDLAGKPLDDLSAALAATTPDPAAAPFMSLPARERAEAVRQAKRR